MSPGMKNGVVAQQRPGWYAATLPRHLREPQWAMLARENTAAEALQWPWQQEEARIARMAHTSPTSTPAFPTRAYSARE